MCRFEIALLDARGAVVPDADTEVRVTLDGGMLLGMDNGNPADHTLPQTPARSTCRGLACGYIRAPRQAGDITLTVEAQGLPAVIRTLTAEA